MQCSIGLAPGNRSRTTPCSRVMRLPRSPHAAALSCSSSRSLPVRTSLSLPASSSLRERPARHVQSHRQRPAQCGDLIGRAEERAVACWRSTSRRSSTTLLGGLPASTYEQKKGSIGRHRRRSHHSALASRPSANEAPARFVSTTRFPRSDLHPREESRR